MYTAACSFDDQTRFSESMDNDVASTKDNLIDVIARDSTCHKQSEMAKSLLAAIVESSDDAIISTDLNGIITSWNAGAGRVFGYSADEAIGLPVTLLIPADRLDEEPGILARIQVGERIQNHETVRRHKGGSLIDVSLTVSPLFDSRGHIFGASKIARDISRRKNAERELEISNARLAEFSRRMSRDLRAATTIQQCFVPHDDLKFEAIDFGWAFRPCDELAGDGLNIIPFDDGKFGMYVLDVSGHGVAPALLSVAMSRILLRHSSVNGCGSGNFLCEPKPTVSPAPTEIASLLNELFPFDGISQQFATITYGVLDPESGVFRFITAGHPGPVVIPAQGEPFLGDATGFPIGIGDGVYEEYMLKLQMRDRLYLYSDGVVEIPNSDQEQFGKERLLRSLHQSRSLGLHESIDCLMRDLVDWHGSDCFPDDISILAVEFMNDA